jgi:hypothetical protein
VDDVKKSKKGSGKMPKMSDHEEYLDSTMVKTGDHVVLLDEGVFREPEETGLNRTVFQIRVRLPDNRMKTWTMNKTTRKRLAIDYGDDSAGWINRSVRIEVLSQNVMGKNKQVVYGHPVEGDPQAPLDDDCESLIELIQDQKKNLSRDDVEKLIQAEVKNSGGMFGRKTAAILVARSLGIDLEKSGSPVST